MAETRAVRQQSVAYTQSTILLIGLCFIFSGATGLIYEVLWARMLGLVFGAATLAVSTVLAAFMGGLALGSAVAGRLASRIKRPLSAYGWLEIESRFTLFWCLSFHWVDNLYALIWQQFHPGFFAFSLWRFALSCLLLLVPTTLMGATLPVLSAALLNLSGHSRGALRSCTHVISVRSSNTCCRVCVFPVLRAHNNSRRSSNQYDHGAAAVIA